MEESRSETIRNKGEETPKKLEDLIAESKETAFGLCKLTPAQFDNYSISEVNEIISACVKEADRRNRFTDMLNARQCEIIAKCAGVKDVKPADFLILKREFSNTPDDTPDQIAQKLSFM